MISRRGFPAAVDLDLLTYWELHSAILHHKCVVFVLWAKGNTEEARESLAVVVNGFTWNCGLCKASFSILGSHGLCLIRSMKTIRRKIFFNGCQV